MMELWLSLALIYFVGLASTAMLAVASGDLDFRGGFWLCFWWPVVLLFCICYRLYQFLTYLFYLRD